MPEMCILSWQVVDWICCTSLKVNIDCGYTCTNRLRWDVSACHMDSITAAWLKWHFSSRFISGYWIRLLVGCRHQLIQDIFGIGMKQNNEHATWLAFRGIGIILIYIEYNLNIWCLKRVGLWWQVIQLYWNIGLCATGDWSFKTSCLLQQGSQRLHCTMNVIV